MDDDIQLPPLPPRPPVIDPDAAMQAYGRACYKAGVVIGERRAKVDAKPQVHEARLSLADNGDWNGGGNPRPGRINILIRWTADGRVWINSERNRDLARILRERFGATEAHAAADALDGGER